MNVWKTYTWTDRQTETYRQRVKDRQTDRDRQRVKDRQSQTDRDKQRDKQTEERKNERHTQTDRQTDRQRPSGRLTQGEAAVQGGVEAAGVGVDGDVGGGGVPLRVADHHSVDDPPARHRAHHGNSVVLPGQGGDLERGRVRVESGSEPVLLLWSSP